MKRYSVIIKEIVMKAVLNVFVRQAVREHTLILLEDILPTLAIFINIANFTLRIDPK